MLKNNTTLSRLLSIRQVAEILNVHVQTLRRWDNNGKLKAIKVNDRGDRRYKQEDIEAFINQRRNSNLPGVYWTKLEPF